MSKGIEFQFCTDWKNWEDVDLFCLQFHDARLLPHVAKVVGWDVAEVMVIDCTNSIVQFHLADGEVQEYKIKAELVLTGE